jgi:hypothetical protein
VWEGGAARLLPIPIEAVEKRIFHRKLAVKMALIVQRHFALWFLF